MALGVLLLPLLHPIDGWFGVRYVSGVGGGQVTCLAVVAVAVLHALHRIELRQRLRLAAFTALLQCYWPPFWTYERTKSSAFSSSTSSISSSKSSNSAFSFSPFSVPAGAASSTSSSVRLGACFLLCSRSPIASHVTPHEPNRSNNSAGLSHPSNNL